MVAERCGEGLINFDEGWSKRCTKQRYHAGEHDFETYSTWEPTEKSRELGPPKERIRRFGSGAVPFNE